jgi:hypothetical protein
MFKILIGLRAQLECLTIKPTKTLRQLKHFKDLMNSKVKLYFKMLARKNGDQWTNLCKILGKHQEKGAKTDDDDVWTPVIVKGEQYSFSKPIWGGTTLKFMGPISVLSDNDFASIVEEAQQYAKNSKNVGTLRTTTSVAPDKDDIFADLFAFC